MKRLFIFYLFLITLFNSKGQNIGGEIIFKNNSSPYTYDFTMTKYTSYPSSNNLLLVSIGMGDGNTLTVNRTDSLILHNNILLSNYKYIHTYPTVANDLFIIYYEDSTNNTLGINYPNSSQFHFYLQSGLNINTLFGINNSVYFADKPIMLGDINKPLKQNLTAIDDDSDSLSFELIDLDGADSNKYWIPNTMILNPINGELSWSNPQQIGKYTFGVLVTEWRHGSQIGFVERRFQIKIDTLNSANHFIINNWNTNFNGDYEYHITPNTNIQLNLVYSDSLADSLKLHAYGDVFNINNHATFNSNVIQYNDYGSFDWTPDTSSIRNNPYIVTFRGSSYINMTLIEQDITVMIYVDRPSSINEINNKDSSLLIYPNPVNSYNIYVSFPFIQNGTYHILNMLGEVITSGIICNTDKIVVNAELYESGCYFVEVQHNNKSQIGKFIKY